MFVFVFVFVFVFAIHVSGAVTVGSRWIPIRFNFCKRQIFIKTQALLPAAYTVKERGKVKSPLLVFFCLFRVFLKELLLLLSVNRPD